MPVSSCCSGSRAGKTAGTELTRHIVVHAVCRWYDRFRCSSPCSCGSRVGEVAIPELTVHIAGHDELMAVICGLNPCHVQRSLLGCMLTCAVCVAGACRHSLVCGVVCAAVCFTAHLDKVMCTRGLDTRPGATVAHMHPRWIACCHLALSVRSRARFRAAVEFGVFYRGINMCLCRGSSSASPTRRLLGFAFRVVGRGPSLAIRFVTCFKERERGGEFEW